MGRRFLSLFVSFVTTFVKNQTFFLDSHMIYESFVYGCFQKIGVPQNGWFTMKNSLKWMIWGFSHIFGNTHI